MSGSKRHYNKKSDYWTKFEKIPASINQIQAQNYEPQLCGEPFYVSDATANTKELIFSKASYSRRGGESPTGSRKM